MNRPAAGLDLDGFGGRMAYAWGSLLSAVRTGAPAYHTIFGCPFWEDLQAHPQIAAGAVRAIVKAQKALKIDPSLAATIGERLFPPEEAPLIAGLIERDAPYYDATISPEAIDGLNRFAKAVGLVPETVPYDRLVATQFRQLWND